MPDQDQSLNVKTPLFSRRVFVQTGVVAMGGLLIGCELEAPAEPSASALNIWLRIEPDGLITFTSPAVEMGQGIHMALAQIIADELEADWEDFRVVDAPFSHDYDIPPFPLQGVFGSLSVRSWYLPLRQAGATAREMLIEAAARRWGVNTTECSARDSAVTHNATGRTISYGELAAAASKLTPLQNPSLKDASDFRLIGQPLKRFDTPPKTEGALTYSMDVQVPGMVYASVLTSPVFGGEVASFDESAIAEMTGVEKIVEIPNGIAVVANSFWRAQKALEALDVQFEGGLDERLTTEMIFEDLLQSTSDDGKVLLEKGDAVAALNGAAQRLTGTYTVPMLSHAGMEPRNATVRINDDSVDVWASTQGQTRTAEQVSNVLGVPIETVRVHCHPIGGSFGVKNYNISIDEKAALIAKHIAKPVKAILSREEDMRAGYFRPAVAFTYDVGLDDDGEMIAIDARLISAREDTTGLRDYPYATPHVRMQYIQKESTIPIGNWRSVSFSHNSFFRESMVDEIAHRVGEDPLAWRRRMLADNPRAIAFIDYMADKSDWGGAIPEGRARGIVVQECFGSYSGQMVELSIDKGELILHRIVCAFEGGTLINPNGVDAQVEGGMIMGLTAALQGQITIAGGRVEQSNFHDYPILHMIDIPDVQMHLMPGTGGPGGAGEAGTPPIAPALTNAIFAATGKRIRSLPILGQDLA